VDPALKNKRETPKHTQKKTPEQSVWKKFLKI
jgi:hypothetical protein